MSIKFKLFSILGLSQLLLVSVLIVSFIVLIERVKNEPQDLRAFEQALQFEKELKFKEEIYKNFIFDLKLNPEYKKIILDGFNNRNSLVSKLDFFKNLMNKNSLSIFELIDKNGKVQFRFHRPW